MMPCRLAIVAVCTFVFCGFPLVGQVDLASRYRLLREGTDGISERPACAGIAVFGARSFGVVHDEGGTVVAAGESDRGKRIVVAGHDSVFKSKSESAIRLLTNSVRHAGGENPRVGFHPSMNEAADVLRSAGFVVSPIPLDKLGSEVCDVYLISGHVLANQSIDVIRRMGGEGPSFVIHATAWAIGEAKRDALNVFLDPFGLRFGGPGGTFGKAQAETLELPANGDAALALAAKHLDGTETLALEVQKRCRDILVAVSQALPDDHPFAVRCAEVVDGRDWIEITPTKPLIRDRRPLDDWIVTEQCRRLARVAPHALPVLPGLSEWPGVATGNITKASGRVLVDGRTLGAGDAYGVNYEKSMVARPTPFWCLPGGADRAWVNVPPELAGMGLAVQVSHDVENMIGANNAKKRYERWPQQSRRFPIDTPATEIGTPTGGLIVILVPTGVDLGRFEVAIEGAVPAPAYCHGQTTNEAWKTIRERPAPWGYLVTDKMTLYVPRTALIALDDPVTVGRYWTRLMNTADHIMGVKARKRGEAATTNQQITVGYGHAGYPFVMAYGMSDCLVSNEIREKGNWGFYHELGHAYQNLRENDYDFSLHGEVQVNMVPSLLMTLEHHRTRGKELGLHGTFDPEKRHAAWQKYFALPEAERTWQKAHDVSPMAYDFYLQLADAFGWELYETALGAMWDEARPRKDFSKEAHVDRNYMALSRAAGRDLAPHFLRYGLVPGAEARKSIDGLDPWEMNRPPLLDAPESIAVEVSRPRVPTPPRVVARTKVTDPDPRNRHVFTLEAGDLSEVLSIDARSGAIVFKDVANVAPGRREVVVTVVDEAVPPFEVRRSIAVEVSEGKRTVDDAEPPEMLAADDRIRLYQFEGTAADVTSTSPFDLSKRPFERCDSVDFGETWKGLPLRVIRILFVAPVSGDYRFHLAGDRVAQLRLSPTDEFEHATAVVTLPHPVAPRDFDDDARCSSEIRHFQKGEKRAMEIRHFAPAGTGHVSLAVTGPDGVRRVL